MSLDGKLTIEEIEQLEHGTKVCLTSIKSDKLPNKIIQENVIFSIDIKNKKLTRPIKPYVNEIWYFDDLDQDFESFIITKVIGGE